MRRTTWGLPRRSGPVQSALPVAALALTLLACSGSTQDAPDRRPDILWVVWDTVRADHLSLYGHSRLTTPDLQAWARDARVFDDCLSTAPNTVPSHASMFTGLLLSEHGTNNRHRFLDDRHATLAELLRQAGYQTYLWSANPHVAREENFHQGFDVEEHPWDPGYRDEALRIVRGKLEPSDRSRRIGIISGSVQRPIA